MSVGEYDNNKLQGYLDPRNCGACSARMQHGIGGKCPSCVRRDNPNPFPDQDGTATNVGSVFTSTVAAELVKTICGDLGIKRDSPPEVVLATFRKLIAKADEISRELGEYQRKPKPMTATTEIYSKLYELHRPMTDAERELVERCLAWLDYLDNEKSTTFDESQERLRSLKMMGRQVLAERKPPEPPTPTPEEVAEKHRVASDAMRAWRAANIALYGRDPGGPITPEEMAVVETAKAAGTGAWPEKGSPQAEALRKSVSRLPLTGVNGKSGVPYP